MKVCKEVKKCKLVKEGGKLVKVCTEVTRCSLVKVTELIKVCKTYELVNKARKLISVCSTLLKVY